MKRQKPKVSLHATLNRALDQLRGIALPEHCVRLARDEAAAAEDRRTFQRTPLLALMAWFSRPAWLQALRAHADLRNALVYVLDRVAHQLEMAAPGDRARTADLACRAARRYLLLLTLRPDLADLECCAEHVEELMAMPALSGAPGSVCSPRSLSCIAAFLKALRCFRTGAPILAAHAWSREKVNETFESFVDTHFLRGRFAGLGSTQWSCLDPLRPLAVGILRNCHDFLATDWTNRQRATHYLIALLCIYYGMDYHDALVLHVGRPASSVPAPGFLDLEGGRLIRSIGSGFFPGDGAFARSELSLPLVPEIAALSAGLGLRADGAPLREQLGHDAHVFYGRWLRRYRTVRLRRMKLGTMGLHLTFDYVALFKCGIYACELSLLRAAPRYGSATECSYVCATEEELVGYWHDVVAVIRRWAKLPGYRGTIAQPERQHGTPSVTLSWYVEMVRQRIRGATRRNELLVAREGLLRCLGRRNSLRHENAAACVRGYPEPALQLIDKWSNGRALGVRYLPLVDAIEKFVELCARHCGEGRLVSYEGKSGEWCASDEVGDRDLAQWLHVGCARQSARTAFFNELRRRRVGTVIRNAAMGHSAELTWESAILPIPNAVLFAQLRETLEAILEESGFATAVAELAAAFERFPAKPQAVDREDYTGESGTATSVAAPFAPLTEVEDFLGCRILANLGRELLPATGWATAVYFSLELGVPFRLLARNMRYVTYRCILVDVVTERVFFFVPIEGTDVGHLDFYPIEIPKTSTAWRHMLARWEELRASRRKLRACLDTPIFDDPEIMADRVAKYVSRLAGTTDERLRFADRDAVRLLERLSGALCRHWQCGSVAGALAMEIPFGLNQIDVAQTVSCITGIPAMLRNLGGDEFEECLFRRGGRRPAPMPDRRARYEEFLERLTYARWPEGLADEAEQAGYLHELFRNADIAPARDRFRHMATQLGSTKPAAARIATLARELSHRHSLLEPTRPEPFPTDEAMQRSGARISARNLDIRHVNPGVRIQRIEDTARSLEMLVGSGCRLSESILTLPEELIEEEEWTAHYIYKSKTDAGRRMVLPGEFKVNEDAVPSREPICAWSRRKLNLNKRHDLQRLEAEKARLQRQVKAILGDDFHPHTLRHYRAYTALVALFQRHRQNFSQMLASIARMFGHASALTFLNSYVGTLLACFAVPPSPLAGLDATWMGRCEARLRRHLRLETLLRDQYSGHTAARAAILREKRRFEALRHNDPSTEGSLECWDLRAEHDDPRLRAALASPSTRVVELPPTPGMPLYWETIAVIWSRAVAAGINVVLDMPRAVQRGWEKRITCISRAAG